MNGATDKLRSRLFDYERPDLIFWAFLVVLALFLFLPFLKPGYMLLPFPDTVYTRTLTDSGYSFPRDDAFRTGFDVNLHFQPWSVYVAERLKQGEIPWWNPYNFCGHPCFANSLYQVTYIPRIIFSLTLAPENVQTALAMLHFLITGFGFYYFLKAFHIRPLAAGFATLLLLMKFSHPTVLMMSTNVVSLAYAPICLLIAIKLIRGGRWLWTLPLAIFISTIISNGYPVFTVHFTYLGIALLVFEILKLRRSGDANIPGNLIKVIAAVVMGFLFSLTQIIPLMQLYPMSVRPELTRSMLVHYGINPSHLGLIFLLNLLSPAGIASRYTSGEFAAYSNLYLGLLPCLIVLPFYGQSRTSEYRFFIIAAIITALISFSSTAFYIAMKIIPGMGLSPSPPFPLMFYCAITAVAFSLNAILSPAADGMKRGGISILVMLIAFVGIPYAAAFLVGRNLGGVFGDFEFYKMNYAGVGFFLGQFILIFSIILLFTGSDRRFSRYLLIFAFLVVSTTYIQLAKTMVHGESDGNSFAITCKGTNTRLNEPRYFNASGTSVLTPNINIYPGMRTAQGYESLLLKNYADTYEKFIGGSLWRMRLAESKRGVAPVEFLKEAGVGKVIVHPDDVPDARIEDICGVELHVVDAGYPECVISSGSCAMNRVSPELIRIDIDTEKNASMNIAETFYPAWKYRIEGEEKSFDVQQSDEGFMQIPNLKPGKYSVELFYQPSLEILGLWLSAAFFIISIILIIRLDGKDIGRGRKNKAA